jgi:hypothetical protein
MLELLWNQYTDEMQLLESNVFEICGKQCTVEFQPSADMSWQSWACNELKQDFRSAFLNCQQVDSHALRDSLPGYLLILLANC